MYAPNVDCAKRKHDRGRATLGSRKGSLYREVDPRSPIVCGFAKSLSVKCTREVGDVPVRAAARAEQS
jgi:hypothetical protein